MMSNTSYHVDSVTGSWAADAHRIPSATTILNTKDITKVNQHDRVYTTATSRHSASGSYTLKRSTPPPFVGTLSPRPRAQQRSATNKVMSPLQESLPNGGVDPTVTRPILSSIETFSKSTHDEGISPLHYASNPRATTRVLKHASPLSGAPINAPVTVSDRLPKSNSSTPLVASPIQSARRSATKDITSVEEYLARARQVAASPPVNECTSPRCTTGNPIQCQHPSQVEEAMAAIKAPSHILLNDLHKIVEQELTHAKQRHRVLDAREEQVEKRAKELLLRERMVDEEIVRLSHAISQQEKLVQHMKEERAARLEDRRQRLTQTAEEKAAETANIAQCVLQHQEEVALLKSQLNDTQSLLIQYQSKPVPVTRLPIPTQTNSDWLNVFESEIEQKLNVTWAQTIEKEKAKLAEELTAENQSMQRIVCKLTLDLFMEQESSERLRHTAVFLEALSDVQKSFQRTWSSEVTLLLNNERKVMQSLHQKWEYSREMLHIQQQQLDEQHEEIQRQHEEIQRQQEEIQRQQGLLNKTPKASTTYQTEEKKGFGEACRALSDDFLDASEEKKEFATEDNLLFNKSLQDDESSEFFPVQMLTLNFEEPPVPCVVLPKSFRPSPSYVETLKEEEEEDSDDDLTDLLNRGSCSQSCSSYGSEARRRLGRRSQKKRTQRRGVAASSRYHLKECFSFEDPEVVHARQYGSRVRGAAAAGEDGPDIIGVEETEASSCVEILAALIDTGVTTEQELMSMLHSGYTPQDIVHLYMSAAQQQSYFLNDSYPSASYGSTAGHEGSTSYEYQNDYDPVTTPGARGELSPSPRMVEEGFCTPDGPRASDTYDPSYEYTGLEESLNREESNYDHVPIMVLPERALRPNPYKTQWESSPLKGRTDSMDHDLSRTEEEMIDDLCSRDGECAPLHGHLNLHDMEKGFSCGLVQGVTERGNSIQSID